MDSKELHMAMSLAVADALNMRVPFTALRFSDMSPLSAPRTFNMPEAEAWLSRNDIYRLEAARRVRHNGKLRAQAFAAKLTNLITRFPRNVVYFGDWHK